MRLDKKLLLSSIVIFALTFLVYLHNLSRSVFGGDVGDFVTAAKVMGVPHPSGYPLITLLGFLLTRIDFMTPAFMVGLVSVFSSSLAVLIFYFFAFELTKNKLISFISSLVLAFNYIFWFYAEIAEVFALNNFFVATLLFLSFLYYKYKKLKFLYLLAFFTGLSLTNNYIISFIFPSMLLLIGTNYKKLIRKPKSLLICFVLGLIGLSVYFYIPVASFFNPPINWGNVNDLNSFTDVILRKHYGTFGVGAVPDLVFVQRFLIQKEYFSTLIFQLTPPVIFLCLFGAISLLKKNKIIFTALFLGFFFSGPFFMALIGLPLQGNFLIGVYERFFTMSSFILLLFLPLGIKAFVQMLNFLFKKNNFEKVFIAVFFIIPLMLFKFNFIKTDLHNVWTGDNLALDLMLPLPKNSYFMTIGDTVVFNTWYSRYALNVRPDIILLSSVGNNNLKEKTDEYLKKFPNEAKNPDLTAKTLQYLTLKNPVFSSAQIQITKGEKLIWMPYGLVYKLLQSTKDIPAKEQFLIMQNNISRSFKNVEFRNDFLSGSSLTIADIPEIYSNALIAQGAFISDQYNDDFLALKFYEKAIEMDKNNRKPYLAIASYYTSKDDCNKVEENISKAIDIYPLDNISYFLHYYNYQYCFKNLAKAKEVVEEYNGLFKGNFFDDIQKYIKNTSK